MTKNPTPKLWACILAAFAAIITLVFFGSRPQAAPKQPKPQTRIATSAFAFARHTGPAIGINPAEAELNKLNLTLDGGLTVGAGQKKEGAQ